MCLNLVETFVNFQIESSIKFSFTVLGAFLLYAFISIIGVVFFVKMLPETRGKALEDIQILFTKPWCSEGPCSTWKNGQEDETMEEIDGR